MYGSRSMSGHRKSPESKILFRACNTWFIVTFAWRIQKSKPFCNLTQWTATTDRGQVSPVHLGHIRPSFCNVFFEYTMHDSEPVWSQDSKNVLFLSVLSLEMLEIAVWKNDIINGYGFWAMCLPKMDISTWYLACQISRHGSITHFIFFL